jgi:hypothetical protein
MMLGEFIPYAADDAEARYLLGAKENPRIAADALLGVAAEPAAEDSACMDPAKNQKSRGPSTASTKK